MLEDFKRMLELKVDEWDICSWLVNAYPDKHEEIFLLMRERGCNFKSTEERMKDGFFPEISMPTCIEIRIKEKDGKAYVQLVKGYMNYSPYFEFASVKEAEDFKSEWAIGPTVSHFYNTYYLVGKPPYEQYEGRMDMTRPAPRCQLDAEMKWWEFLARPSVSIENWENIRI